MFSKLKVNEYTCVFKAIQCLKLTVSHPDDRIFIGVVSDVSVVLRETTLTIQILLRQAQQFEKEIESVVSLSTTEITEIKR